MTYDRDAIATTEIRMIDNEITRKTAPSPKWFMVLVDGFTGDQANHILDGPIYPVPTPSQARWRAWVDFREAGYGRGMTFRDFLNISRVRKYKK